MGQGSFSAKCTGLYNQLHVTYCDETNNGSQLTDARAKKQLGLGDEYKAPTLR